MAAQNIEYRFIDNVGEYFPSGFFGDDFYKSIVAASGLTADELKKLAEPFKQLRPEYDKFKNYIVNNQPRPRDANRHTHLFHTRLLNLLGYDTTGPYEWCDVDGDAGAVIPVRQILRRGTQPKLYVMEMQHMIKTAEAEPAGIFDQQYATATDDVQKYRAAQWADVFTLPAGCRLSPAVVSKAIDAIFLMPEDRRPHYILLLAGNMVFLMDSDKWSRGAYLQFSLDELFYQASAKSFGNLFALFALLVRHDSLAPDAEAPLMDTINEEGYRNAFAVTQDLRDGVILAIETLANEALYYKKNVAHIPFGKYNEKSGLPKDDPDAYDVTDDSFEDEVRDDCLTIVYPCSSSSLPRAGRTWAFCLWTTRSTDSAIRSTCSATWSAKGSTPKTRTDIFSTPQFTASSTCSIADTAPRARATSPSAKSTRPSSAMPTSGSSAA